MRARFALVAEALAVTISTPAGAMDASYSGVATTGYAQSDTDDAIVSYAGQPEGIDSDGTLSDQESYSLGLSYQMPPLPVLKGAVAKLQYDQIEADEINGMYNAVQPGFDGEVNMVSLSFDVLFQGAA